ncbi:hypothetical protein [Kitasatospora sp. NBC_01266]|uniref:hypothetical protein n=1 Tax=Kitasatospora sp. NBC_01266 TaxID=2903572 RepID=UPI002E2F4E36|nr:hypothetical protein [Kitasatospora sp. NBC_01266]
MDIVSAGTITEAITAAAGAAGTAVGRQAWDSLQTLVRRLRRPGEPAAEVAEPDPSDGPGVRELIGTVLEHHEDDPDFAADLAAWTRTHAAALNVTVTYDHSSVRNTVSGNARVTKMVQGRDISGAINF